MQYIGPIIMCLLVVFGIYCVSKKVNNFYYAFLGCFGGLIIQYILFFQIPHINRVWLSIFSLLVTIELLFFLYYYLDRMLLVARTTQKILKLVLSLVPLLILPNFFFGFIYLIWSSNGTIEYNLVDTLYFSFAINYSLPLILNKFLYLQEFVNGYFLLQITQMIHIVVSKIVELIIIGLISAKVIERITESE